MRYSLKSTILLLSICSAIPQNGSFLRSDKYIAPQISASSFRRSSAHFTLPHFPTDNMNGDFFYTVILTSYMTLFISPFPAAFIPAQIKMALAHARATATTLFNLVHLRSVYGIYIENPATLGWACKMLIINHYENTISSTWSSFEFIKIPQGLLSLTFEFSN